MPWVCGALMAAAAAWWLLQQSAQPSTRSHLFRFEPFECLCGSFNWAVRGMVERLHAPACRRVYVAAAAVEQSFALQPGHSPPCNIGAWNK
jgi:hypothetical protein